ncbi:MAG: ribose-phosphate pyrophosphokinase [Ruminococcaceae bacterium]|nr:ribose-phosphate pyrophosphokinase [Oscillospiraceae bacterium]
MSENLRGDLSVITLKGGEHFAEQVDSYLKQWRGGNESFIIKPDWPRFGTGEGKCVLHDSMRGHDVYIIADVFNYGVRYKMYGESVPMSPDEHYQDLKRLICAIEGKASRVSLIMPMLYEGRQHKRTMRESLDCATALQELTQVGISNIITFDAHDPRVQNAIPNYGFDNVHPTYQMIKALIAEYSDISLKKENLMIVSPDEGAMSRCMYYSSVLGLDLGVFYKRRNYSIVVDGRNPIEAHEYLGRSVKGKDIIVVDDMISSGESMFEVASKLKERGAKRVFIFTTFGLFCNGLDRFDEMHTQGVFDKVFTTNLVYGTEELKARPWYHEVNMCKYVALLIDTLNHDKSISPLLKPVDRINKLLSKLPADKRN